MECPDCGGTMKEGYIPIVRAIHWREKDQPVGIAPAWKGLPGIKLSWLRPTKLHAFRCEQCEVVGFRYGDHAEHL
jgi:hypothetical protein